MNMIREGPLPSGTCPKCGGNAELSSIGPYFDDGCYFVCGDNYDACHYSGPIYANLDAARIGPEVMPCSDGQNCMLPDCPSHVPAGYLL